MFSRNEIFFFFFYFFYEIFITFALGNETFSFADCTK